MWSVIKIGKALELRTVFHGAYKGALSVPPKKGEEIQKTFQEVLD